MGTPRASWPAKELRTKSMADRLFVSRRRRATAEAEEAATATIRIVATNAANKTVGLASRLKSGTSVGSAQSSSLKASTAGRPAARKAGTMVTASTAR